MNVVGNVVLGRVLQKNKSLVLVLVLKKSETLIRSSSR
jgi:hypothetical protein